MDGLAETASVQKWSVGESAKFLVERTGDSDGVAAEGLARDLDGLAMALEQAAAYVTGRRRLRTPSGGFPS